MDGTHAALGKGEEVLAQPNVRGVGTHTHRGPQGLMHVPMDSTEGGQQARFTSAAHFYEYV